MGVTIEGREIEETVGFGWGCHASTILLYPRTPGHPHRALGRLESMLSHFHPGLSGGRINATHENGEIDFSLLLTVTVEPFQ